MSFVKFLVLGNFRQGFLFVNGIKTINYTYIHVVNEYNIHKDTYSHLSYSIIYHHKSSS